MPPSEVSLNVIHRGFLSSLLLATCGFAIGCGFSVRGVEGNTPESAASGIVGGAVVEPGSDLAKIMVLVAETETSQICTGTLIAENLVLTAAHCVGSKPSSVRLYFGISPFSDPATPERAVVDMEVHPDYNGATDVPSARHDLAVLRFAGGLPEGFQSLSIEQPAMTEAHLPFIAAGYGRNDGRLAKQDLESDGSGILRFVKQQITEASADGSHFTISQMNGEGVCPGDSGGPALVKTNTGWTQIGVASALSIASDEPHVGREDFDYCAQGAIYMDLRRYRSWALEASARLLLGEKLGRGASDLAGSLEQNPVAGLRDHTQAPRRP